jgi:hypothetical protein
LKYIKYFLDLGLDVGITLDGSLKIQGLSSLEDAVKKEALEYAKKNKPFIVLELQNQNKTHQQQYDSLWKKATALADWVDDSSSPVPWQERAARVPELQGMSSEIDRMIAHQKDAPKKAPLFKDMSLDPNPDVIKKEKPVPPENKPIQPEDCPARYKRSGRCHGQAYFDG